MIDLNLTGKQAVVTGASLGIGAAVVKLLADQGAEVVSCAREEDGVALLAKYQPEGPGKVSGFAADMGNASSTNRFLSQVEALGGSDILVNNVVASPSRNFLYQKLSLYE
ncbi:MAG: SDR family NAD(P)-dependent oxidoreductase [Pseudomonadales bacterium]|jgi:NAD(P)-dependent dehydrogenase (short-subunit alcohol dehydrogenase family)|nr:SDR family NAD(P)-dependent oxidoreductase [Pseudomonadales bacterium]